MEWLFWILGGAFVGYVVWVLMTSDGKRRRGGSRDTGGRGWFGGGWDGDGGGSGSDGGSN